MIQLDFPVGTAAEALSSRPREVGFSQHEGGERADWGSDKLQIVGGTHPVVYPAMGSHANYYSANLWLGRSAAQGVGCDDTVGPSRQLRPEVAPLPDGEGAIPGRVPLARLRRRLGRGAPAVLRRPDRPEHEGAVDGADHLGERVVAGLGVRDPGRYLVGPSTTDFFCGAVAAGSSVLTKLVANPTAVLIALGVLLVILIWLARARAGTRPRRSASPRRRPWGSLVTGAAPPVRAPAAGVPGDRPRSSCRSPC